MKCFTGTTRIWLTILIVKIKGSGNTILPERLISVTVIMLKTLMLILSCGEMTLNSHE